MKEDDTVGSPVGAGHIGAGSVPADGESDRCRPGQGLPQGERHGGHHGCFYMASVCTTAVNIIAKKAVLEPGGWALWVGRALFR